MPAALIDGLPPSLGAPLSLPARPGPLIGSVDSACCPRFASGKAKGFWISPEALDSPWSRGSDLNRRPLGYESEETSAK